MKVQLANTYSPIKNYGVKHWYASPKLDGIRAIYSEEGFLTRSGKPIIGFTDIERELAQLCGKNGWSFIDGELLISGRSFQAVQSAVLSKSHNDKCKIKFHPFAVGGNFSDTSEMLGSISNAKRAKVKPIPFVKVENDAKEISDIGRKFVEAGYEGVMLRHPDVHYHKGRSNHLLKHKFFSEADLRIVEAFEGNGAFEDMLGSLTVEGEIGGVKIRSGVGSGLSVEDRYILFEDENLIGKILSVKYQSITEQPDDNGFYSLRFPVALGVKEDR